MNIRNGAFTFLLFVVLAAMGGPPTAAAEEADWYSVEGSPHITVPSEMFSPAVEITVVHEHADGPPTVDYASGVLVNRHIWPGRSIKPYERITRNSPGDDESPQGARLPLALFPRREGIAWGGEMLTTATLDGVRTSDEPDTRTLHQKQWDYIQAHVERAFEHYSATRKYIWPEGDKKPRGTAPGKLTPWQKFHAICNYAAAWQGREPGSNRFGIHPVDVLHHGHHCGGVSQIIMSMFHVAGFESRILAWSCHASTEVKIGDKWVFADMIIRGGGEFRSCHSWAEISAEPKLIMPAVLSFIAKPTARESLVYLYRSPMYWQFSIPARESEFPKQYMLGVRYNPSTASALYPELRIHLFHIRKDARPALKICQAGLGDQALVPLRKGQALRKRFFISDCRDNPIVEAKALIRIRSGLNPEEFTCALDGRELPPGVKEDGGLVLQVAPPLLSPGEHELIVRKSGGEETKAADVAFYADVVRPYLNPISGGAVRLNATHWPEKIDDPNAKKPQPDAAQQE